MLMNRLSHALAPLMAAMLALVACTTPVLGAPIDGLPTPPEPAPVVVPISAPTSAAAELTVARVEMAQALAHMGMTPQEAVDAARSLTMDDINVLLAHPSMLQYAGATSSHNQGIIIGVLILVGLIALAWAGDGSLSF